MKRLGAVALIAVAALAAGALLILPPGLLGSLVDGAMILRGGARFPPDESRVYKETPTRPLAVHIFRPRAADEASASATIVLLHGGGFHSGWPDELFPLATELAASGYAAFVPEYRLQRADGVGWDDEFEDALDAIRWSQQHASEFGGDADHLFLAGSSAGAHLATAAVAVPPPPGRPRPEADGLLLIAAYVDSAGHSTRFERRARDSSWLGRVLLGPPQDVFEGRSRESSPREHLHAAMPPALLMMGENDGLLPDAEDFCRSLRALGPRCQVKSYGDAGHAFGLFGYEHYRAMVDDSLAALSEWIRESPSPNDS